MRHRRDDFIRAGGAGLPHAGHRAVAQHRDAVAHRKHIAQVVRDINHRVTVAAQRADDVQHLRGLRHAQGRGRLVQQHHRRLGANRARNRHRLALAAGQQADFGAHRCQGVHLQFGHRLARVLLHGHAAQRAQQARQPPPAGGGLAAEEQVGGDIQVLAQREVLEHGLDAGRGRGLRRMNRQLRAVQQQAAGVGALHAGDDFHQRGFARAVVADQPGHLAAPRLQIDAAQGLHGAEVFGDAADAQVRRVAPGCGGGRGRGISRDPGRVFRHTG